MGGTDQMNVVKGCPVIRKEGIKKDVYCQIWSKILVSECNEIATKLSKRKFP